MARPWKLRSVLLCLLLPIPSIVFSAPSQVILNDGGNGTLITPELQAFVELVMREFDLPGVSLGIVKKGVSETKGFGGRNEDGDPVTPETLFHIGDNSMAFASMALCVLMHEYGFGRNSTPLPGGVHELSWDTKVKNLLPGPDEWELQWQYPTLMATFSDLLSRSIGLTGYELFIKPGQTPSERLEQLRHFKMASELRQRWHYNRSLYTTLQLVIDKLTGNFTEYVASRIFRPVGMNATTYSLREAEATGHVSQGWEMNVKLDDWNKFSRRRIPVGFTLDTGGVTTAPSGALSNAKDMLRWLDVLLSRGMDRDTHEDIIYWYSVIQGTLPWAAMGGYIIPAELSETVYSTGWIRDSYRGHQRIWHSSGGMHYFPGSTTLAAYFPTDDVGVFIGINADSYTVGADRAADVLLYGAADSVFGLPNQFPMSTGLQEQEQHFLRTNFGESKVLSAPGGFKLLKSGTKGNGDDPYIGKYINDVHGTIFACNIGEDDDSYPRYCDAMRQDFKAAGLVGEFMVTNFSSIYGTHTVPLLLPFTRVLVVLAIMNLYPKGYGNNMTAFYTWRLAQEAIILPGIGIGVYETNTPFNPDGASPEEIKRTSSIWYSYERFG